jgi:hypothetical protein
MKLSSTEKTETASDRNTEKSSGNGDLWTDPDSSHGSFRASLSLAVFGFDDPAAVYNQMSEEQLAVLDRRFATVCAVAASEFGGKLVSLPMGQKVLTFGVPDPHELDAERAVLAAQKVLRSFEWSSFKCPARLRCGIASGEGFIVLDSGPNMSPLAVSGPVYDKASQLEQHAPGNVLLVSADARALFRSNFMARKVQLGTEEEIAWEVSPAIVPSTRFDPRDQDPRLRYFMGRMKEVRLLAKSWATSKTGLAQTVLIEGEPGIGKSSLMSAFLKKVQTDQPLVLNFLGSAHHKRTPYFPVAQGLFAFLGLKGMQSPSLLSTVIHNFLNDLGLETMRDNANLRAILKSDGIESHVPRVEVAADNPVETLIACFRRLSDVNPVILVFEDAHWMDPSTLKLIDALPGALGHSRVLSLVSTRAGTGPEKLPGSADAICRLDNLPEAEARALADLLRPSDMTDAQFDTIVHRSDGIPLFLEELMNIAAERGSHFFERGPENLIPASLRETLAARLSHLGSNRDMLHLAAVIGREFNISLLSAVTGVPEDELAIQLEAFQRSNLIYPVGTPQHGLFEFKHSLVQDLAYQSIEPGARSRYHARIAEALTETTERYPPAAPEVIARHFQHAGNVPAALDYLEVAGIEAVRVAAHREAGRYFQKALELAQDIGDEAERDIAVSRFLLLLGPQLITNHGFASSEVQEVYARARQLTVSDTGSPEILQMLWGLWGAHIVKADLAFAKTLSADFLRTARARQNDLEISAGLYMTGVGAFYVGDLARAEKLLLSSVEAALAADFDEMITKYSLDLGILARSYLNWCYALMDRPDDMQNNALSLETAALLSDHAFCQAFSSCFLSTTHNFLGNFAEAEHHALAAAALSREQGFAQQLAQADINLGRAQVTSGNPSGLERMLDGLKAYLETGAVLARPYTEAWIAEAQLHRGDLETAVNRLIEVRRFTRRSGERYYDAELLRLSALAAKATRPHARHLVGTLLGKSASHARRSGTDLHLLNLKPHLAGFSTV